MGAFLCCLRQEDLGYEQGSNGWCCHRCCRRFCLGCCCCGMYAALFHPSEEHDGSAALSASPSQSAGLLDGTSSGGSVPIVYSTPPDRRYIFPVGDGSRPGKFAATLLQTGGPEILQRSNGGNGHEGAPVRQCGKGTDYVEGKKSTDCLSKFQQAKKIGKVESLTSLIDDEDICPTCLEGYDRENPKINTKCGHHFHLACILEWMERSSHCPVCYQEMEFNESP